ncbi:hypothetical protein BS78_08G141800 [Paspalum vaginatum]|nr:hypothetical protein BS78_08G141800 [Paspalum vaginatum]
MGETGVTRTGGEREEEEDADPGAAAGGEIAGAREEEDEADPKRCRPRRSGRWRAEGPPDAGRRRRARETASGRRRCTMVVCERIRFGKREKSRPSQLRLSGQKVGRLNYD